LNISRKYALKAAKVVIACALLAGCNVFSMVGILDGSSSTTSSGGSTTLKLLPSAANIVVNTTKQFTATGGSGGYTYSVDAGGVGGTIDVSGLYHAPLSDTGTDSVTVTDSTGASMTATAMVVPPGTDPLTISPASATISVGGTITFTANGGSGVVSGYTKISGGGTLVGATYTAPGSADTPVIRVTDSALNTADAAITVNAPPAVSISPSTTTRNVGQTVTFAGSGGSGNPANYSYSKIAGAGTLVAATYTAPGVGEIATIRLTDLLTLQTQDATVNVIAPVALVINPITPSLNVGQSVSFTGSGGSGNPANYSYSKIAGAGTLVGATYTAPGVGEIATIRLTDLLTLQTQDATVTVTAPSALAITPASPNIIDTGSVSFTGSGGSGNPANYSYSTIAGAGTLVGATYTAPAFAEIATIRLTDSLTLQTADALVGVTVPVGLSISPKTISIAAGGTVTFTAGGGTSPYNYVKLDGGGTFNIGTHVYTAPWSATTAHIQVTDNVLATDIATVTVNPPPALAISPSAPTLNVGQTVTFTGNGGSGNPANYSYAKISGGGTFNGVTHVYTAPGSGTTAVIRLTDSVTSQTSDANVTVNAPAALAISPSTTTLNVGQTVTLTGSGGSGNPANYSYAKISGAGTFNGVTHVYTAPGSATIVAIRLTDTLTLQTSDSTVTVPAPPPLTFTPATSNVVVGNAVTLTPGGGSGSYTCSLVSGTGTLVPATFTYTTVAAETSVIRLLDTVTLSTLDATVQSFFTLTITPSTASVQVNSTYPFSASGGVPPYTFSVSVGTGTVTPATGIFTAPGAAQSDTVKVTDSVLNTATSSVTVNPPGPWNIASIDAIARSGQYASLALDGSGNPRIAYYEGQGKELRLATWNGSSWSVQTVDSSTSNIGQYCSLALAPGTGYPRISYYDAHNHDLRYAAWNGSSWSKQTVASSGDVGKYTSLALEPGTGYPRISYYDETNDNLKYTWWNGSSWNFQTIDIPGSVGLNTSLALEPGTNSPRISYYDKTNKWLKFAFSNDGGVTWTVRTADNGTDVGLYSSLALEPGINRPRISYYDKFNKLLKYAWSNDGGLTWTRQTVDNGSGNDVGMYNSLALEPGTNLPRISYYDNTTQDLKYASWNGATWTIQTVDTPNNVGSYTSLKLYPFAPYNPRIAYYDSTSQDLKFASEPPP
jgi:plastocyanin